MKTRRIASPGLQVPALGLRCMGMCEFYGGVNRGIGNNRALTRVGHD